MQRKPEKLVIKDMIVDASFERAITHPQEMDVLISTNLNADYLSDALAALVGGLGIAPGANINFDTGDAIFEAVHGTAPNIAGQNKANPCSMILSAVLMLRYLGWNEAANLIENGLRKTLASKNVTADFFEQMKNATLLIHYRNSPSRSSRECRMAKVKNNIFQTAILNIHGTDYHFFPLAQLKTGSSNELNALPYCIRILLENAMRNYDGECISRESMAALYGWSTTPGDHGSFLFHAGQDPAARPDRSSPGGRSGLAPICCCASGKGSMPASIH